MVDINKVAIGWTVGIVAVFMAIAIGGSQLEQFSVAQVTPDVQPPEPPAPVDEPLDPVNKEKAMKTEEKGAQTADPFADIAQKVKEQATMEDTNVQREATQSLQAEREFAEQVQEEPNIVPISIPKGTAVPGCEETNECYIPYSVTVKKGTTIIWTNADIAAHTVTSGTPQSGPTGEFDSSLIPAGATYEKIFENSGTYDYFCMVHPWMTGTITVE